MGIFCCPSRRLRGQIGGRDDVAKKELIKANIKFLYKFLLTTGFKEEDVAKILADKEAIL